MVKIGPSCLGDSNLDEISFLAAGYLAFPSPTLFLKIGKLPNRAGLVSFRFSSKCAGLPVIIVSPGRLWMELQGQTHPFMEKSTGGGGGVRGALVRSPVGIPSNQLQALKAPPFPFLGTLSNGENRKIFFSVEASLCLMCDNPHCVKTCPTICLWQRFHCLRLRFIVCNSQWRDNRLVAAHCKPLFVTSYIYF